ncbi:MAG: shikimate dehydrogenase family protein, partial [Alphaproteobacteria bacterium]
DAFGFVAAIKQQQPRFNFKKGAAAVLGAGGAARAIAHGLLDEGVPELYIFNRTKTNAESVAAGSEAGRIKILNWDERETALASVNIVVNTTSLGMDGQPALDMSLGALNKNALVADIVYKPLKTSLIRDAEARGNPAVPGIGMLLHQARPAFQAWFGIMPEIDETLEKLVSA